MTTVVVACDSRAEAEGLAAHLKTLGVSAEIKKDVIVQFPIEDTDVLKAQEMIASFYPAERKHKSKSSLVQIGQWRTPSGNRVTAWLPADAKDAAVLGQVNSFRVVLKTKRSPSQDDKDFLQPLIENAMKRFVGVPEDTIVVPSSEVN